MRILTRKILILALGLSLLAEVASFTGMALIHSDTVLFRALFAFHRPGIEAAGLLIPELHEDDPNMSALDLGIVWMVFTSAALIQWFIIFLASVLAWRHFSERRYENISAA